MLEDWTNYEEREKTERADEDRAAMAINLLPAPLSRHREIVSDRPPSMKQRSKQFVVDLATIGSPARDIILQSPMEHVAAVGYDRFEKPTCVKDRWKEKEMNNGSTKNSSTKRAAQPRTIGRSTLALFAGFVASVVLSLATDLGLQPLACGPL